ncbi:efflux RND transporter periplasmic adaptor subunit [Vibrio sp. SCSIO 43137]|uniref:efflux RND transporter periplasmic adaptor subunit n=1 Tax=Vibrio sp. SCSIO 43137 TaxID=3021011 RepID=UPI002307BEC7|nr:efflux RND transporter periplasmic adaptor subunit [Vibrio sp. SCSIO 43137]WCE31619.1 efflux RND transporter periplasmic adaptor subunit [Vibrio sp. SCSIO 43137]
MKDRAFVTVYKVALLAASGLFLAGCFPAKSEVQEEVVKPVKLLQVPDLRASQFDSFLAEVDAGERSQLSFQVPGVIKTFDIREGEKVEKGQLLAELDPNDYQLAVDAAQAQYDLAETRFERNKQLFSKKLISADTFDQSETAFKTADATLQQAITDLGYTKITAPYSGIVSLSFVKTHQYVGAKQQILNIINNDQLDIDISLPVPYVKEVGVITLPEKEYAVVFDVHNSIAIPARFKEMSTQPDADTNSYSATVSILRPDSLNILTGMTGQVLIRNEKAQTGLMLPEDAWISKQGNKGKVWRFVKETNSVVETELELDQFGAVISGLNSGDMVVIAGAKDLHEGQVVRAWTREGGI